MPNRLVREGFLDSERIHNLSDPAECLYHRLMLAADDAGRMDGRAEVLRARLFPLDSSRRASDVEAQLRECIIQKLVIRYECDGKPFIQITKWQRCSPCANSKFPWSDGGHTVLYRKIQTRDGIRDFVASSLQVDMPSLSLTEGIPKTYEATSTYPSSSSTPSPDGTDPAATIAGVEHPSEAEFVEFCAHPTCGIRESDARELWLKGQETGWMKGQTRIVDWRSWARRQRKWIEQNKAELASRSGVKETPTKSKPCLV